MKLTRRSMLMSSTALVLASAMSRAQADVNRPELVAGIPVNYDESKVGDWRLPDILTTENGEAVRTAEDWFLKRRPEILRMFEELQYGAAPGKPEALAFETRESGSAAYGGKAVRKQVRITFQPDRSGPAIDLVVYTPAAAAAPSPMLLAVGFTSNAAMLEDPDVNPGSIWSADENRRIPYERGSQTFFGKIDPVPLLDAGIGFATFYYGDVDPDDPDGLMQGVRSLYLKPGETAVAADAWGSIAAWGWGISRIIDYFEEDEDIDAAQIAIQGVSRLGKTVMWAGARDTRIAATIASCSGEGGAALSRRNYGETIAHLVEPSRYPYQFAANYAKFADRPTEAPFDANLLVALHAPRPLLLQTGDTDHWSDPKGEFLAAVDAGKAYRLLRKIDLGTDVWPAAGRPILGDLSYYMHEGGHGTIPSDWDVYLRFLKMHLQPKV